MLYEVMKSINNYFIESENHAKWEIKDGTLSLPFLKENQYFMIDGSTFNDGVYKKGDVFLTDEVFDGYVYGLAIPQSFLDLVKEIESYQQKYGDKVSPYSSESFDGYSYSKSSGSSNDSGEVSWKTAFNSRLRIWRKV